MSAFIVTKEHIDAIVTPVQESRIHNGQMDGMDVDQIGQALWTLNYESVNYRYHGNNLPPRYQWKKKVVSPVEALKLLNCYHYQSCEQPNYKQSPAYELMEAIQDIIIDSLPGYNEAEWSI